MARKNFIFKYGIDIAPNSNGIGTVFTVNNRTGNIGFGTTNPQSKVHVVGTIIADNFTGNSSYSLQAETATNVSGGIASVTQLNVSGITNLGVVTSGNIFSTGIITASSFSGNSSSATQLQNSRNFSIGGDFITAPSVSFNGTGNVALAATITPDSIILGTYTSGDYVKNISGTTNQITVTGGTGESSIPTISLPNQFTAPQDVTITRDLQVNRNLSVNGTVTIGGTSATIFSQELKVGDPDIVLGFRTDGSGNDISTDNTANHGGVALASTDGSPLVQLFIAGIETNPATYKKIMWFKKDSFTGLGTDAWLINYAVGIGSTQFPSGTRLAAGSVQFTERDLAVVRNINASGVITATTFSGSGASLTSIPNSALNNSTISGVSLGSNLNTLTLNTSGTGLSGSATYNGSGAATFTVTSNATSSNTASTIIARDASGNFSAGSITAVTEVLSGNLAAWNTTTPGTSVGGLHLGAASGTSNVGPAITFGARDASSGANGQAGIYINSDGTYGTRMYFATTDSYAAGSRNAISINESGLVTIIRSNLNINGNGSTLYGPNSTWSQYLRVGGNGNADTTNASVVTTNGNLHIDSKTGNFATYLNFYKGTGGVSFGNGGGANAVAWMGPDGDLWKGSADNTGSVYWHAGNDGAGSGLDADLLDGISSGSFIRSDVDTNVTQTVGPRFGHTNQTDTNDGFISAGKFGSGLNIVGTQTVASTGRQIRLWGSVITDGGASYWNSGNDGSGSGLDADLLDGYNAAVGPTSSTVTVRNTSGQIQAAWYESPYTGGNSGITRSGRAYDFGFQESGGWSFPYPDLIFQYHTGVTLAANASYEGIRFKADFNDDTLIFQVNGSSSYLFKYRWMYTTSDGFYSDTNNAHWNPNVSSSYGSWRMVGSRNGWTGIYFETGGNQLTHLMFESNNGGFYSQNSGRWWQYYNYSNACWGFNSSTTSSSYVIYASGAIYSTGNITAFSDARRKTNVNTIENALDKVLKLRGVTYNKLDKTTSEIDQKLETGVIAQEVNEVFPEVVTYANDVDEYGVSYGNFAGLFIEAFKEQTAIINNLKKEIEELKSKLGE